MRELDGAVRIEILDGAEELLRLVEFQKPGVQFDRLSCPDILGELEGAGANVIVVEENVERTLPCHGSVHPHGPTKSLDLAVVDELRGPFRTIDVNGRAVAGKPDRARVHREAAALGHADGQVGGEELVHVDACRTDVDDAILRHRAQNPDPRFEVGLGDRKSTRLNSSHPSISYAVFCLKKK